MWKKLLLSFLFVFSLALPSFAHKITAFTDLEDGKLSIYSYFSDGTPAKHAKVTIYDEKTGRVVITGYTDKKGDYSCKLPRPGKYKVVVLAELGHRAVSEVNYGGSSSGENTGKVSEGKSEEASSKTVSIGSGVSAEEIRKIVREELKPIDSKLLKIEEKVSSISLTEVFGGLGWIVGIFGAAAFGFTYGRKRS